MVRAFVAIELGDALRQAVGAVVGDLARRLPKSIKWTRLESMHLTLKFLGEIPDDKVTPVSDVLAAVASRSQVFDAGVARAGCFPNARKPRIVWVGMDDTRGLLAALHSGVDEALAPLGFAPDERVFSPHLTVGRVGKARSSELKKLAELVGQSAVGSIGTLVVSTLTLMRSQLGPGGSVYTPLARFPLSPAAV